MTTPDFEAFSDAALAGRVWIAGACPATTARLGQLRPLAPSGVVFVSFGVDPEHDTPAALAGCARAFQAGPDWRFLSGPRQEIERLLRGLRLTTSEQPDDKVLSSRLVLVDAARRVRGVYDSGDERQVSRLLADMRRLETSRRLGPYQRLPRVNAALNATSGLLLAFGYSMIRVRRTAAHAASMLAAVATSAAFLGCYVYYHAHVGSVRFEGAPALRSVYLTILGTHTLAAVGVVPLVLMTLARALRGRFAAHRVLARWTLPIWGYVSVTGVVVYWMLYRLTA